jgi:hypothetical protein
MPWWERFSSHEIGRIDGGRGCRTRKNAFRIGGNTFYNRKNKILMKIPEFKRSGIGLIAEFRGILNRFSNLGDFVACCSFGGTWGILLLPVLLEALGGFFCLLFFWRHFLGDNFLGGRLPSFCLPFFWFFWLIATWCIVLHLHPLPSLLWASPSVLSCFYLTESPLFSLKGGSWPTF